MLMIRIHLEERQVGAFDPRTLVTIVQRSRAERNGAWTSLYPSRTYIKVQRSEAKLEQAPIPRVRTILGRERSEVRTSLYPSIITVVRCTRWGKW